MRTLIINSSNIVINIVDYPTETPETDEEGNLLVPDPSFTVVDVGTVFDTATYLNLLRRTQAQDQLDVPDAIPRLLRAIVELTVNQLNILRAQVVGIGTLVFNPPSMSNGTGTTSAAITVTGAAFGDFVDVAAPYTLAGIVATGYVSAANTVVIRLHNSTGAAVDLASGTWRVCVRRPVVLAPLTLLQARNAIKAEIAAGDVDT